MKELKENKSNKKDRPTIIEVIIWKTEKCIDNATSAKKCSR